MRTDSSNYISKNQASSKTPFYTIEIAFDSDFTILRYLTSHTSAQYPTGASVIAGCVQSISGTSQRISPEAAISSIGSISVSAVDLTNQLMNLIYTQNELGRTLKNKRLRVYKGFEDLDWADYSLVETQIIQDIEYNDGVYTINCSDIQREARQEIFVLNETTLTADIAEDDTLIPVASYDDFEFFWRSTAYTDTTPSPNSQVCYIKIDDEVIRCVGTVVDGTLGPCFIADIRGALSTLATTHKSDSSANASNRKSVKEFVYIEMPVVKLIYAILTGNLLNSGSPLHVLPSNWHLGIDPSYVDINDFNNIGLDLYDSSDDTNGRIERFEDISKQDGKQFIEKELAYFIGCYMPIYSTGEIGLKRMPRVTANASYQRLLDEDNVISYSTIKHSMKDLLNVLDINWNFDWLEKRYTRNTIQIDSDSVAIYGQSINKLVQFRGLNGNRHTEETIAGFFEAIRDRYSGPPILMTVNVLPSNEDIEVGDIVRVKLSQVYDFETNSTLDRSFEVQQVQKNWVTGDITLTLFGSTRVASPIAPTIGSTVLADSYYSSEGTELTTALDAQSPQGQYSLTGGVLHLESNATLTGNADLTNAAAIYYYLGDLTIDAGVTLTITDNVQLRVMGFLTVNGTIDGAGQGIAGGGSAGFVGSTESGGGVYNDVYGLFGTFYPVVHNSIRGKQLIGLNAEPPFLQITNESGVLSGFPTDLRGTPGLAGESNYNGTGWAPAESPGGAGGAGGAGLAVISRGASIGPAGTVNVSGADGIKPALRTFTAPNPDYTVYPGTGGGGAPGAVYFLIDGSSAATPLLSRITANYGACQTQGTPFYNPGAFNDPTIINSELPRHSYYQGKGGIAIGAATARIQFLPGASSPEQTPIIGKLSAPTSLIVSSGTDQLIKERDGTIVVRALLSWTASTDERTVGYDTQYKRSDGSIWYTGPSVVGGEEAYIIGVQSGVNYDFRVRAVSGFNQSSDWLTITAENIIGKTEAPPDCDSFTVTRLADGTRVFNGGLIDANVPVDFAGYRIKAALGTSLSWNQLTPMHKGVIASLPWETNQLAAGNYTAGIVAVDTSGNESANAVLISSTLGDPRLKSALYNIDLYNEGWPGTLTNCFVEDTGYITAADQKDWASFGGDSPVTTWAGWTSWSRSPYQTIYFETDVIDAGAVLTFTPLVSISSNGVTTIEESHSDGDTSPWTWSSYAAVGSQLTARYIKIRVTVTVPSPVEHLYIYSGGIILDAEDVIEIIEDLNTSTIASPVAAGDLRLPITKNFTSIKSVQIALQNVGGGGWTWELIDKNPTLGPRIKIYNGSGTLADATIDAEIKGY